MTKLHRALKARLAEGMSMHFWKVDMQRLPKPIVCHLLGMKIQVLLKAAGRLFSRK